MARRDGKFRIVIGSIANELVTESNLSKHRNHTVVENSQGIIKDIVMILQINVNSIRTVT